MLGLRREYAAAETTAGGRPALSQRLQAGLLRTAESVERSADPAAGASEPTNTATPYAPWPVVRAACCPGQLQRVCCLRCAAHNTATIGWPEPAGPAPAAAEARPSLRDG